MPQERKISPLLCHPLPFAGFLLQPFDEYYVGYTGFAEAVSGGKPLPKNLYVGSPVVIDGQVVGTWRRTLKKRTVTVEIESFETLTTPKRKSVIMAIERYGKFVGLPVNCKFL